MIPLSPKKRSELRAQAHTLTPVVLVGDKGLTEEVVAEVERSLVAHELIKVRAMTDDRKARNSWLEALCERLSAHAVQQIGKVFVLYRENLEKTAKAKKAAKAKLGPGLRRGDPARENAGSVKRSERPRSRTPSPRPASEPRQRRPRSSR